MSGYRYRSETRQVIIVFIYQGRRISLRPCFITNDVDFTIHVWYCNFMKEGEVYAGQK